MKITIYRNIKRNDIILIEDGQQNRLLLGKGIKKVYKIKKIKAPFSIRKTKRGK